MVDCIVKRADLKSQVAQFIEFLTGNERAFEKDELAKKMPGALKELLRIAEEIHV
jgi:hypothetical protein